MAQNMKPKQRGDVRVMLSLSPDIAQELKEAAQEEVLPVAALARRCVVMYLRDRRRCHDERQPRARRAEDAP